MAGVRLLVAVVITVNRRLALAQSTCSMETRSNGIFINAMERWKYWNDSVQRLKKPILLFVKYRAIKKLSKNKLIKLNEFVENSTSTVIS